MSRNYLCMRAPGRLVWVQVSLLVFWAILYCVQKLSLKEWHRSFTAYVNNSAPIVKIPLNEIVPGFLWLALHIDVIIIGLLFLLSPWWLRLITSEGTSKIFNPVKFTRRTIIWLMLGLTLALTLRVARIERGVERDEQDTVRRNIIGYNFIDNDGSEHNVKLDWMNTLWEDKQANNPFLFSALTRVSLRAWQAVSGAEPWQVNFVVLRLWAIIPGMASLVALWWWLCMLERPTAAGLAVFLGAIHPMHVDFSTQARGYALVMLFCTLALCFSWLALGQGKWWHWCAHAACLLGALYSSPLSIYFAASLGATLSVVLTWRWLRLHDSVARRDLLRFIITSLAAAMIYLPLVLPAVPQALGYLRTFNGALDGPWVPQCWTKYAAGVLKPDMADCQAWDSSGLSAWEYICQHYPVQEPLLFIVVWIFVPALIITGIWALIKKDSRALPLVIGGCLAPIVAYFGHRSADTPFLYYWYLIFSLPLLIAMTATGLEVFHTVIPKRFGLLNIIPPALFFAAFIVVNIQASGHILWLPPAASSPEEYIRGHFRWITYADGKTMRIPIEASK